MLRIRDHKRETCGPSQSHDEPWVDRDTSNATTSSCCPRRARGGKGQREAPFLNNRRLFDAGESPRRNAPGPSPGRHAATRSRRGSGSSGPTERPTGSGARDPRARPSSQSFSRGYGSILPTSLAYIVPSTERLFTLETRCGYEYGPGVNGTRSSGFSRVAGGAPDTTRRPRRRLRTP
ncbi:unnamed protein product [Prunus brigantina]